MSLLKVFSNRSYTGFTGLQCEKTLEIIESSWRNPDWYHKWHHLKTTCKNIRWKMLSTWQNKATMLWKFFSKAERCFKVLSYEIIWFKKLCHPFVERWIQNKVKHTYITNLIPNWIKWLWAHQVMQWFIYVIGASKCSPLLEQENCDDPYQQLILLLSHGIRR